MQHEYSAAGKISSQFTLQYEYHAAKILCSMNTFSQLTRYSPAARATWHQSGCVGVQGTDGKGTSLIQGTKFIQVLCDLHKIGWNMLVTKYYRLVSCLNQSGTFGGTKVLVPDAITLVPPPFFGWFSSHSAPIYASEAMIFQTPWL